uniref:T-cell surface glycoprotein CD3 zeta chain n=1 Tax=Gouania willdenowi TaxID=441366 RepID=A0A8C5DGT6_GOUWI
NMLKNYITNVLCKYNVYGFLLPIEATTYDPKLCYILDGFLGIYGLFITGMFIKEKVSLTQLEPDLNKHSDREYRELPNAKDLSSATRDTYHTLQMQPLSVR